MLDLGKEWWLTTEGDYEAAAMEVMRFDGSNWQRVIALTWPARMNHGKEHKTLRMLISPEDAIGLANTLMHTAKWLIAATEIIPEEPDG